MMDTVLSWIMFAGQCLTGIASVVAVTVFQAEGQLRHLLFALFFGMATASSYQLQAWWPLVLGLIGWLLLTKAKHHPESQGEAFFRAGLARPHSALSLSRVFL